MHNLASVIHSFHLCHSKLFVNLLCHVLYSLNKCVTELKELVEKNENVKANGLNARSEIYDLFLEIQDILARYLSTLRHCFEN